MQTEMTVADGERFVQLVWQMYAKYCNATVIPLKRSEANEQPVLPMRREVSAMSQRM